MLTHFWPGNDRERTRAAARAAYGADLLLADDGVEVVLP